MCLSIILFTKKIDLNKKYNTSVRFNYSIIVILAIYAPFVVAFNYIELRDHNSTNFIMFFLFVIAALVRLNTLASIVILIIYGAIYFFQLSLLHLTIDKVPVMYIVGFGVLMFFFFITNYLTRREIILIENELLLKEKNEKLNILNANLELAHDKIEKQNKFLTESNANFKNFAAIAAHDLKSPLRTLAGFTQILSNNYRDIYTSKDKEISDFIAKSSLSLQHLVDDILTFSDINKNLPEKQKLSLSTLLKETVDTLNNQVEKNKAQINLPANDFYIFGHPSLFSQLFINLLNNSIKFKKAEKNTVININTYTSYNGNLCIVIEDNGIGIDKTLLIKIYEPFSKLHNSNYEGSGLGLSTCKKIVDFYKGTIVIESELGVGTKTIITFPKEIMHKT